LGQIGIAALGFAFLDHMQAFDRKIPATARSLAAVQDKPASCVGRFASLMLTLDQLHYASRQQWYLEKL